MSPFNSFSCYLFSRPFGYVLSIRVLFSKIVLPSLHLFASLCSCNFYLLFGRLFFRYFGISCSIVSLDPVSVSFKLPFFCQYLLINLLYCQICLLFWFSLFLSSIFSCFSFFSTFASCCSSSSLISHLGFVFLFGFLMRYWFYHWLFLLLYKFAGLVQWCFPLGHLVIICLPFWFLS